MTDQRFDIDAYKMRSQVNALISYAMITIKELQREYFNPILTSGRGVFWPPLPNSLIAPKQ